MPQPFHTLVLDIGNSSTSAALYRQGRVMRPQRIPSASVEPARLRDFLARLVGSRRVDRVVGACVVPRLNAPWNRAARAGLGLPVHWVSHRSPLGLPIRYPHPETIGPDRLVNAAGAFARYGAPVVVADLGTALTFEVISRKGEFVGGIIAPGFPMMLSYLAERTARLPRIEPRAVRRLVGKSTEESMRIGAEHGYRGLVRELFQGLREELGADGLTQVATGGYARRVLAGLDPGIRVDPDLTLFGLGRIGDLCG